MILCPRCQNPLDAAHDESACLRRGLTRRIFFGLFAGAAAAMAVPDVWGKADVNPSTLWPGDYYWMGDKNPLRFHNNCTLLFQLPGTGFTVPACPSGADRWIIEDPDANIPHGNLYVVSQPRRPSWMKEPR